MKKLVYWLGVILIIVGIVVDHNQSWLQALGQIVLILIGIVLLVATSEDK